MKCSNCGKWNQSTLPHCVYCGEPLESIDPYTRRPVPAWREELKDDGANAYLRVDDSGEVEATRDPRDKLAKEMAELKIRKLQGEIQQRKLRASAAERGLAPSSRSVRTTTNRGTFFSAVDNPEATLRPVDPALIEAGDVEEDAQIVYTEKYRPKGSQTQVRREQSPPSFGFTQRVQGMGETPDEQPVYDGYHDTSAYIPFQNRQDEYEHSLRMRDSGSWVPRRFGMRRLMRALLIIVSVLVVGWLGWAVVLPMINASNNKAIAEVTITPTIRDDLAAHTITIPGQEGQRITIRELRTSAIVTGGVATFDIPDHQWYDNFEDYLQETMAVTLTPYLMTDTGKQQPLEPIHYDIDIPLSPIELATPDNPYKVVSTAMYNIILYVRAGSTVLINGQDYSDLVNTDDGKVSYNATVQPIGENHYDIVVRSQYCRENTMTVTLFREKQDIPLDLQSDIASRSTDPVLTIRANTLPGAVVKVLSPYTDLDITNTDTDGTFTFKATFDHIGDNMITITADYPGKKTTTVDHNVYYVPSIDEYSRKAWDIVGQYTDLMDNLDLRKKKTQIYVCIGKVVSIETTKPQRAFMECTSDASPNPVTVYIENSSRTNWEEGQTYRLYADAFGMYDSKPWLVVRYTYSKGEY